MFASLLLQGSRLKPYRCGLSCLVIVKYLQYFILLKTQVYDSLNAMIAAKAVNPFYYFTLSEPPPKNGSIQTDTIPVCVGVSVQGTCNYRVSIALWPGVPVRRTPLPPFGL